ncbi:MAG: MMPL family transporter [Proteobacteria bacterium]|nr:MMPL family transporter [Pseudomonadota bacterium]
MMKRLGDIIIDKRVPVGLVFTAITLMFLYFAVTRLTVKTIFSDLLPTNHAYINLHNEVRDKFGGANQVLIMIQVRDKEDGGQLNDIFNHETLSIVKSIEEDLLLFPGVDRNKIFSLASRKLKDFKVTASGMTLSDVMFPNVPTTPEGLENLRKIVYGSPVCYPALVSFDSKKTLIMADFFEDKIDYKAVFKELQKLRKKYENTNNIVAISGEPMHLGYIDSYVGDVLKILGYTVLAMMVVFLLFFRSKRGMILPIIAGAVSAIWGLGFLSMFNFNLDPLVIVFPFLIAAMAASHSVQIIKRYKEEAFLVKDVKQACKNTVNALFAPGLAGILTDSAGLLVVALTPIPALQKISLACGFWAFATVAIVMLMTPILLSYMPLRAVEEGKGWLDHVLRRTGYWICGWGKYLVLAVALVVTVWGTTYINKITIGNAVPGSEVLWPWHRFNVDSFRITFAMPLLNPLFIVVEGDEAQAIGLNPALMRDVNELSRYLSRTPGMRVIFPMSYLMQVPARHRAVRDNDPNWSFLPTTDMQLKMLSKQIVTMSAPGSMDKYIDTDERTMNIIVYCRDKTGDTIRAVVTRTKDYIREKSAFGVRAKDVERKGIDKFVYWVDGLVSTQEPPIPEKPQVEGMPKAYYRLAGGAVGVQAAINEALELYSFWTFVIAFVVVFFMVSAIFKSFLIYLVSRIIEEYRRTNSWEESIAEALGTTGRAIIYTGITIVIGIAFWFLSKMMFQAMMGMLLAIILLINMLGALLIIPSYIAVFKPKFIVRAAQQGK